MTETQEQFFAQELLAFAKRMAFCSNGHPEDQSAATAAILMHALTLATPDLSAERRAGLFLENEE